MQISSEGLAVFYISFGRVSRVLYIFFHIKENIFNTVLVKVVKTSVADPDPVGSGLFWAPISGSASLVHKQIPIYLLFFEI